MQNIAFIFMALIAVFSVQKASLFCNKHRELLTTKQINPLLIDLLCPYLLKRFKR